MARLFGMFSYESHGSNASILECIVVPHTALHSGIEGVYRLLRSGRSQVARRGGIITTVTRRGLTKWWWCPAVGANANTSVTRGRDGSRGGANFGGNQFGGRPARPDHDKSDDYEYAIFTQFS
jgi:hypothetical protein